MRSWKIEAASLLTLAALAGSAIAQDQPKTDEQPQADPALQDPTLKDDTATPTEAARVGMPAPEISLIGLDGNKVDLASFRGRIVVLEWLSPDCQFSAKHHQENDTIKNLVEDFKDDNVVFLGIVSGSAAGTATEPTLPAGAERQGEHDALPQPKQPGTTDPVAPPAGATKPEDDKALGRLREVVNAWEIGYPVLLDADAKVACSYGVKVTPHVFVIDQQGTLRYSGAIDDNPSAEKVGWTNYLKDAIEAVKDGDEVEKSVTVPYGTKIECGPAKGACDPGMKDAGTKE